MPKSAKGLSMMELVIVIAVLAILSVGSFIYIGFINTSKLDAAAQKMAADIRFAQNQAINTTVWHGIRFEADPSNKYYIYQTDGASDTLITDPADFSKNYEVNVGQLFSGVTISSVDLEGGEGKMEFNGVGRPYTDYYLYEGHVVWQEGTVALSAGGSSKTIRITPNTGRVSIE